MRPINEIILALRDAREALEQLDHRSMDLAQEVSRLELALQRMERRIWESRDECTNPVERIPDELTGSD